MTPSTVGAQQAAPHLGKMSDGQGLSQVAPPLCVPSANSVLNSDAFSFPSRTFNDRRSRNRSFGSCWCRAPAAHVKFPQAPRRTRPNGPAGLHPGSAAFLSAITAMRIAIHGREVTMPNLTGKNVTEATSLLRSHGLVLKVADRVYSELPINVVVRQTPPAGLLMKESQQAHVVLSLGQAPTPNPAPRRQFPARLPYRTPPRRPASRRSHRHHHARKACRRSRNPDAAPRHGRRDSPRRRPSLPRPPRIRLRNAPFVGMTESDAQRRLDASGLRRKVNYVSARNGPTAP